MNQAVQAFGRNDADVVVLYRSATMTVSDPAYRQAVTAALDQLPRADVAKVPTYWSGGSTRLVSADRHATYAALQLTGADDAARHKTYEAIQAGLTPASVAAGLTAKVRLVVLLSPGRRVPAVAANGIDGASMLLRRHRWGIDAVTWRPVRGTAGRAG